MFFQRQTICQDEPSGRRGLWAALAASVGLHVVLLTQGAAPQALKIEAQTLQAHLLPAPPALPPSSAPAQAAAHTVTHAPAHPIHTAPTAAVSAPPVAGAPPEAPQPAAMSAALSSTEATAPARAEIDADGLRRYRLALAAHMRDYRHYPRAAVANGLSGTAEVRVSLNAGVPLQVSLAHGSGFRLLDDAALEMLRQAAAQTPVPPALQGQSVVVSVPVVFSVLTDE